MSDIAPLLNVEAEFSEPMQCLFRPKRYKVLYGGRGAGRSWGVARALLIMGSQRSIRVLCVREWQNSIAESVHKVLSDQIELLGMGDIYEVEKDKIWCRFNKTEFTFAGIKNNYRKIRSTEGVDYCWVEEANNVSEASWEVLIPTIRRDGSEIWITFNPDLETDYTYKRFVKSPPTESFVVKMNWRDNPWFPEVLRQEMEDLKARDYDAYLNVWEGHCRVSLDGAIYAKELRRTIEDGRICSVPWAREVPVDTFWDLGRSDRTCIWFAQKVAMQYRVLAYFEDNLEDIHFYLRHLQSRGYTYGTHWLPHDAKAKALGSKRSIEEIVRATYPSVRITPRLSPIDGINACRMIFPSCWFDEKKCEKGLERLRHYRWKVVDGQITDKPLHDEASDGADAFRTLGLSIGISRKPKSIADKLGLPVNKFMDQAPGLGWLG